jgi:hypothetical protein
MKTTLFFVCGAIGILGGIFGKDFQAADGETGLPYDEKIPKLRGRIISFAVGIFFLILGIASLI